MASGPTSSNKSWPSPISIDEDEQALLPSAPVWDAHQYHYLAYYGGSYPRPLDGPAPECNYMYPYPYRLFSGPTTWTDVNGGHEHEVSVSVLAS